MKYKTEDGKEVETGSYAYDYYSMKPGHIGKDSGGFEGWFDFHHTDGTTELLNGQRICSIKFAIRRKFPHVAELCEGHPSDDGWAEYCDGSCKDGAKV